MEATEAINSEDMVVMVVTDSEVTEATNLEAMAVTVALSLEDMAATEVIGSEDMAATEATSSEDTEVATNLIRPQAKKNTSQYVNFYYF